MKSLALAILFAIAPFAAHANNLVQNGSFEDAPTIGGGLFDNIGCSTILTQCAIVPSWNASGDINALITNGASAQTYLDGGAGILASDGSNFIGVDGSCCNLGPVSQMLTGLTAGDTYTLSFDQAAAQLGGNYGATTEQWIVSIGGSISGSPGTVLLSDNTTPYNPAYYVVGYDDEWRSPVINNASGGFSGWQTVTETFVANSSSELLAFLGVGTPIGAPPMVLLDNVSVTGASTPEPATLLPGAAGILLLAILVLRRKAAR